MNGYDITGISPELYSMIIGATQPVEGRPEYMQAALAGGTPAYYPVGIPSQGLPAGLYSPVATAGIGGGTYIPTTYQAQYAAGAATMVTGQDAPETLPVGAIAAGIPAIAGALGMTLPAWLLTLLGIGGVAAAGYGIYQGITSTPITIDGITLSGPGVPEPAPGTFSKTWQTKYQRKDGRDGLVYHWLLNDGRIICWNNLTGKATIYRPQKPVAVVMRGGKMSMTQFLRLDRYLDKFTRRIAKRSKRLKLAY